MASSSFPILSPVSGIESLLTPQSIAVVGASGDRGKIGAMPLHFLRQYGYAGRLYPVNPNYEAIGDLRCYPSISTVPESVDLMVVTVPASRIPALLQECPTGWVKTALVLSSGYAELGEDGDRRQRELVGLAAGKGIRICGPNSVGSVNLWDAVVPSISQAFDRILQPGPIAFVTQSGALGTAVIALADAAGIKLGYFINTGNEADLTFTDFCEYFIADPRTRIIAGYVEGIRDGRQFADCARRALAAGKPIVVLKVGRSPVGTAAARSHTGAVTGSDELYDAVFRHNGVTRVGSIEEMLDALKMFSAVGPAPGNRAVLASHSGGTGVLMSDVCAEEGLQLPPVGDAVKEQLRSRLPNFASLENPIDMSAAVMFQPKLMVGCLGDALESADFDVGALSVNLMWRVRDELAAELAALRQRTSKPFGVAWIGIADQTAVQLQQADVPAYSDPVRCVRALAHLVRWSETCRVQRQASGAPADVAPIASLPSPSGTSVGGYREQARLLERYGIPLAPWALVRSVDEARGAAESLGYPIVAKIISERFSHKSDVGGVALGLTSADEVSRAVDRFLTITGGDWGSGGILIQPLVSNATEVFVGAQRDPVFGPFVVVGLGGIFVEVLRETSVRLTPVSEREALGMVTSARWSPLLCGVRGQERRDVGALARLIRQVSWLVEHERIASIDLNPVMVRSDGGGVVVVDFRMFGLDEEVPPV